MPKQFTENIKAIAGLIKRPPTQIYDYVAGRSTVGKEMAVSLEAACKSLKIDCSREVWAWGTAAQKKRRLK